MESREWKGDGSDICEGSFSDISDLANYCAEANRSFVGRRLDIALALLDIRETIARLVCCPTGLLRGLMTIGGEKLPSCCHFLSRRSPCNGGSQSLHGTLGENIVSTIFETVRSYSVFVPTKHRVNIFHQSPGASFASTPWTSFPVPFRSRSISYTCEY